MADLSGQDLLEAGSHFGHQTKRWNPKMAQYILAARNGIHLINLKKTLSCLIEAKAAVKKTIESGKTILFVGTKKQASDTIKEEAKRCGAFYASYRWLGGMMTNYETIRKSIRVLASIEREEKDNFPGRPKKETLKMLKHKEKLLNVLDGIREMRKVPGLMFIVDPKKENIALAEAKKLKIPVVSLLDTNCDPNAVEYPIPANDDAIKSISVITKEIADAVLSADPKIIKKSIEANEAAAMKKSGEKFDKSKNTKPRRPIRKKVVKKAPVKDNASTPSATEPVVEKAAEDIK